ncbi:MAG TPA: hypothetical protein VF665_06275 [Longimicrobium sp.]|jgi:hypothetical protein|uniref:hypothetical protein n=1 Tax=Longimicrobium sp. TaxID=2029185 RepID=UPI002ED7C00D
MIKKLALMGSVAALAAVSPFTLQSASDGQPYRLEVSCASAAEAEASSELVAAEPIANAGCEPAAGYVCTTPRADYLDKRPI